MTTHHSSPWRAGCEETHTSGSAGGGEETTGRKAATAPRRRPNSRHRTSRASASSPCSAKSSRANEPMFRAFLLKEELRLLYQLEDPALAPAHLDAWLAWPSRSRLAPFVKLARTIRRHRAGILAAIRLGLSNGRLEGLNSRIRLISHRSSGFHSAAPLIALVYLCRTGIAIDLPR
jgi:transposase